MAVLTCISASPHSAVNTVHLVLDAGPLQNQMQAPGIRGRNPKDAAGPPRSLEGKSAHNCIVNWAREVDHGRLAGGA